MRRPSRIGPRFGARKSGTPVGRADLSAFAGPDRCSPVQTHFRSFAPAGQSGTPLLRFSFPSAHAGHAALSAVADCRTFPLRRFCPPHGPHAKSRIGRAAALAVFRLTRRAGAISGPPPVDVARRKPCFPSPHQGDVPLRPASRGIRGPVGTGQSRRRSWDFQPFAVLFLPAGHRMFPSDRAHMPLSATPAPALLCRVSGRRHLETLPCNAGGRSRTMLTSFWDSPLRAIRFRPGDNRRQPADTALGFASLRSADARPIGHASSDLEPSLKAISLHRRFDESTGYPLVGFVAITSKCTAQSAVAGHSACRRPFSVLRG